MAKAGHRISPVIRMLVVMKLLNVAGVTLDPWVGSEYCKQKVRLLILGESRYDKEFTDRRIIREQGHCKPTFTKFVKAALSKQQSMSPTECKVFWKKTLFYNYNVTLFPRGPRVPLQYEQRECIQNRQCLRLVLQKFKPTHAIVWGFMNYDSLMVDGADWSSEEHILDSDAKFCHVTIDGHMTLFTWVRHPSAGFSINYWAGVLKAFFDHSLRESNI